MSNQPGTWKHPAFDEYLRRQVAGRFGDAEFRNLFFNVQAVLDTLSDIPFTPSQRAILHLSPQNALPHTPGAKYSTPPRYKTVPRNISDMSKLSVSPSSPSSLSSSLTAATARNTPLPPDWRSTSFSSPTSNSNARHHVSPIPSSPFQQRSTNSMMGGSLGPAAGASAGAGLGGAEFDSSLALSTPTRGSSGGVAYGSNQFSASGGFYDSVYSPSTPSPSASLPSPNRVISPILTNKWLYQKTRPMESGNGGFR
ncbi:cell wall biogenesis protein [Ascosphaera aggregata]|nr:cell wall biogenesis protein [Ascosphaera aggregata]